MTLTNEEVQKVLKTAFLAAIRRGFSTFDADDIASDVALAILSNLSKGQEIKQLEPFTRGVAANVIASRWRKRHHQTNFDHAEKIIDPTIFDEASFEEMFRLFNKALVAGLSEIEQKTFSIRLEQKSSIDEIAAETGLSAWEVRKTLATVERKMTASLQPYPELCRLLLSRLPKPPRKAKS